MNSTAALVLGSLAGCSQDDSDTAKGPAQDDGDGGNDDDEDTTTDGDSDAPEDKTEIRFWAGLGGDKLQLLKEMAADFNEQSDSTHVKVSSKGNYNETMNAAISAVRSGDPPAVVQINGANTALARDSGAFAAISDMLPDINWDDFIPATTNFYSLEGKPHSMPFNASTPVMYYNMDKFEEAGVDPIFEPSDQDIIDMGNQLLDADVGLEYACTWPNHSWFVEQWFALQDQELVNNGNGREGNPDEIFLDSDAGKRIYEWQNQLYQDGLYFNPGIEAWGAAKQSFLTEKSAIMIISSAGVNEVTQGAKEEAGFDVKTAYLPAPDDQRKGVFIGGGSLWTPKNIDDEMSEAATEYIQWMVQPDQQVRWHKGTGYFPVRKSAVEALEDEGWFEENPNYRTAFDQLQNSEPTQATAGPVVGPSSFMREQNEKAFVDLMEGGNLEQVLATRKENIEEELESYKDKV